eukprot:8292125-Pyramimonas_sp.AAC.1
MLDGGSVALEDIRVKMRCCARTPFLGFRRRESPLLLRRDDPESCHNVPGTATQRINVIVAP